MTTIKASCTCCGTDFSYELNRSGRRRRFCSDACRTEGKRRHDAARRDAPRVTIDLASERRRLRRAKPAPVTADSEKKQLCDLIVERAAMLMQGEVGAPLGMIIDRLLTFSAAQMVSMDGASSAASVLRAAAGQIEAGAFAAIDAERVAH